MIFKPSASNLQRSMKCCASNIIPIRVSTENERAERGTWLHKYIELIIGGKLPEAAIYYIPEEYKDACRRTDVSFLTGLHDVQSEVSFAVDFNTGDVRYLGQGLNRDYPELGESEFSGTLDIYAKRDNKAVLIDMKSGMMTTPAESNAQIWFGAYALHKLYNHDSVESSLLYLREGEENVFDHYKFTDFKSIFAEFNRYYNRLAKEEWRYVHGGQLNLVEGTWCEYCPSAIACPSKVNAIRALAGKIGDKDNFDDVKVSVSKLNNEQLATAWVNYMKIKNYYDVAEKALRAKIREVGGIKADTFKVIPTECTRKSQDANKLLKLARRLGATDSDIDNAITVNTFTRLREVPVTDNNKDDIE
jgi:hypothetical protein